MTADRPPRTSIDAGLRADGRRLDSLGCDLWEFRDGKVLKKDTYYKQVTR